MKKRLFVCSIVAMLVTGIIGSAAAFENVTAQEAYDMVNSGQAILIDVRTLEECYWVGMPAVTPGGLYVIPWQTTTIGPDGTVTREPNLDFEPLILQSFPDKLQPLIIMCRSGGRSTFAAEVLEEVLGYENIYEIDNALKEASSSYGGRGGFQGTSYGGAYNGYRGYPERLPVNTSSKQTTMVTDTDRIRSPENSTSWMDTGLPITQDLNNAVIPVLSQ